MSDVSAPHCTGVPPSRNIYTLQVHEPCIGSKFNSGNTILQHLHLAGLRAMLLLYSNRTIIMQYLHLAGLRAMYPPHTYQRFHNLPIFTPFRFISRVSAPHLPSGTTILQYLHLAGLRAMYPLHTLQWYPNLAIVTPCKLISDMSAPHSPAVPQSCNSYTLQVYEQCIRSPLSSGTTILQYLHLEGL